MLDKAKGAGVVVICFAIVLGLIFLSLAFLKGVVSVGAWALPFLSGLVGITMVFVLPLLVLLAVARRTRAVSAAGFLVASSLFGLTLWTWALLYTLMTWGWFAVILGLAPAGLGVVPIAMLAALFHSEWSTLGQLFLGLFLTFGSRMFGLYLAAKGAEASADLSHAVV